MLRMYPQRMIVSSSYTGPVAAACGRDETGLVGLVFWAEQVNQVHVGDVIRIESGVVSLTGRRLGGEHRKAWKIEHRQPF